MSILYGTKINQLLANTAPTGLLFKNEKNGKIAKIFQYAYYADTKRLLFTATDRRQAKWINKDHYRNSSVWKIIFTFHTFLSVYEKYWRDRRPYYKDCT